MTARNLLFILFLLFTRENLHSQELTQNVKGLVLDQVTKQPLWGATVKLHGHDRAVITDSLGRFTLASVPVGRLQLEVSFTGYHLFISDDILVNSAKEVYREIELEEVKNIEETVVIRTNRYPKQPVNRSVMVSGRSFSPEETQRFAASANDPGRMALGFPGVQATRDTRSDIIIRANNPMGMQWRLEGQDIINPNHFARIGSTGGGITILSLSMLEKSDFLTGAMPAEYGDVLSGVFDMHLRRGNDQENEHSFKAGMIGIDFSSEGPLEKGRSSYLVNYRYSTLGLLNKIGLNLVGERESNTFQDLAFNLSFKNRKNTSQWKVWGLWGHSREEYEAVDDPAEWKQYDDYALYDFRTRMAVVGVSHQATFSEKSFLRSSLLYLSQSIQWDDDTLSQNLIPERIGSRDFENDRLSLSSVYNHKYNAASDLKLGFYLSNLYYDLRSFSSFTRSFRGEGKAVQVQPFVQFSARPTDKLSFITGLHALIIDMNNQSALDPRFSFQYRINASQTIGLGYGIYSKVPPLGNYIRTGSASLQGQAQNQLELLRAHHYVISYDQVMKKGWRWHMEAYYQRLFRVPVSRDSSRTFWLLNEMEGYTGEYFVNKGRGRNMGMDFTLEKVFINNFFMIANFSLFDSRYQPLNGKYYHSRFNAGTSGSFTGAKEWPLKNNKVLQLGWKAIYNGGYRITPLAATQHGSRVPVLDESRAYEDKISPYFRTDGRISLRKDKKGKSWQLALDLQNVFGIRNTDALSRRYDPSVNQWIYDHQSGMVPLLSYQIDF